MGSTQSISQPTPARHRAPGLFGVIGALAVAYLVVPLLALATRVPWGRLADIATQPATRDMVALSVAAAAQSAALATVLGVGLALWLHHLGRAAQCVRLFVYLPLALPPVVGGLALSAAWGRRGWLAPLLETLGVHFAFAFPGVVLAHLFVIIPFVVVAVDSALRQLDPEIIHSARGVGLRPWTISTRIIAPAITPAIFTGAALAFARSLGEFGTTLTFAGSLPGVTRTLPSGIYLERDINPDTAYGLAAILIATALVALLVAALPLLPRALHTQRPVAQAPSGQMDNAALLRLSSPQLAGTAPPSLHCAGAVFPGGCATAIVGPNGSGKTTLGGIVSGRLRGDAVLRGSTNISATPAHLRGIAMLTQRPGLPTTGTVERAVNMVTGSHQRTQQLLAAAGLAHLSGVHTSQLSGGQAAQVALVRALAARPRFVILDEPFAALDVESAAAWREFFRQDAARAQRSTIVVSHDVIDVASLCTHAVVLDAGQVIATGTVSQVFSRPPNRFVSALAGLNYLRVRTTSSGRLHPDPNGTRMVCQLADTELLTDDAPGTADAKEPEWWVEAQVRAIEATDFLAGARVLLDAAGYPLHAPVTGQAPPVGAQVRVRFHTATFYELP
ncbi:ATP-binding cassette domain-containing protein [Corynebacterium lizhenjunii]|uniref:ATP-binding cassette domain-containing protein n=1 Tax=Corynebacterium lizhenjunii TaxID=2709394 RepID=UPI0013E9F454|nr:ATP-binding cassette domain-containing protein [Corynebacterium lizhenjunii]